jgi:hypothetical protein
MKAITPAVELASQPVRYYELSPRGTAWWAGGVLIRCVRCHEMLGEAEYRTWSDQSGVWVGSGGCRVTLHHALTPEGLDRATHLPSYGPRQRVRRKGVTPSRGRPPGTPPQHSSKQPHIGRAAILHCWARTCNKRQVFDLPLVWTVDGEIDEGALPMRGNPIFWLQRQ